jgi:NDP-sugar pyrophosphorylase family protein
VLKHYAVPYGVLETGADGLLEQIQEKPEFTFKINSGMYILEPQLLAEIPENTHFHITELIEKVRARGGRVGVFPVSEGAWMDIGEWHEYNKTVKKMGFVDIVSIT